MILLALALALAAPPDRDAQTRAYMNCVRTTAQRLEPSGDAPQEVARAATAFCQDFETPLFTAQPSTSMQLRETAIYYGAAQVVAARLCRKTKDCELNRISK